MADLKRAVKLAHRLVLSRVNASLTCRGRAKRKTLCAPQSRKRSWSSSQFALPDVPDAPTWGTVLTAAPDHIKQATYSPFDCNYSTSHRPNAQPSLFRTSFDILFIL